MTISGVNDVHRYGNKVLEALEQTAFDRRIPVASPSYEGVRLIFPEGWALLRLSLHDPNMPLNIESKEAGGCHMIKRRLYNLLAQYEHLDTTPLK